MDKSSVNKSSFIGIVGPRPTFVISVRNPKDNIDYAMAAEWTTPLSINPPLFGIVIAHDTNTHEAIKETGIFAVNVLPIDRLDEVWYLGTKSAQKKEDKISKVGLTAVEGSSDRHAIAIEEAAATIECRLKEEVKMNNFSLFIGEVLAAQVDEVVYDTDNEIWVPENIGFIFHVAGDVFVTNKKSIIQP